MTEANETQAPALMERVVVGKPFSTVDPESGKRYSAMPGTTVFVRPLTAAKNGKQLVDPKVAAAQKLAAEAETQALADAAALQEQAIPATPVQKAPEPEAKVEGDDPPGGDQ